LLGYKAYLPQELHGDFDAWAAQFHDPWEDLDAEMYDPDDINAVMGRASFVSPYSWESDTRIEHMDAGGIAAEVVFPNTVPPFYPSGVITALAPRTEAEYRYRWAGIKAHNRWLADFCKEAPGRRAGLAQVFLNDLDEAIAEVRWARASGLAGVLIPGDNVVLYDAQLDPFWAVCSELDLPVHRHSIIVSESASEFGPAAGAVGAHEIQFWFMRALAHLVFGGVFQRFPDLKFVLTETGCAWVPDELRKLDFEIQIGKTAGNVGHVAFGKAAEALDLSASEYFHRNCYLGVSLARPEEMQLRHQIGVEQLMWGADYPHTEGTFPHTRLGLRLLFAGVPEDEIRVMTSLSAAKVYGLDLDFLQPIADRIGPTVEEVATPVLPEELPRSTMSATIGAGAQALKASL
jgi:predicted TIM-barrel fold metal-dependent hydrolase